MTELRDLKPYKKDITWKGSKVRWCKIIDKYGVPLINFDISEDKADFIINRINNHDALLTACEDAQYAYNYVISRTPAGPVREKLTERNIERMAAIAGAKE